MTIKTSKRIFISYRRKTGIDTARWIYEQLKRRGYDVFLDMESLRTGAFDANLRKEIKNSDVFLIVLSKKSLNRCIWRSDWVRQEISCAMQNGIPIIPVMKEEFDFPKRLPADIAPLRMQNGLRISYDFFDPFVDKLEEYICDAPKKPVRYDFSKAENEPKWNQYVIGALVALLLTGLVFFGIRGCHVDPNVKPDQDSPAQTTTEVSQTEPLSDSIEVIGNTPGNQCNDGVAAADGTMEATVYRWKYICSIDDWKYWYDDDSKTIMAQCGDEERMSLITHQFLDYLLVTDKYIYYSVLDGESSLYRISRFAENMSHENAECLVQGLSAQNNIFIDGEYAYYFRGGIGLFRYSLMDKKEDLLLSYESTMDIDTMGMFNGRIYLYTENEITRLNLDNSVLESVFTLDESFGDAKIVAGNASEQWLYFAVTDSGKSGQTHADRIYRIYVDGSSLELFFVKDSIGCKIENIAISGSDYLFLSMKCGSGEEHCLYSIRRDNGEFAGSVYYHPQGFPQVTGIDVGNSVTNLCNDAFSAVQLSKKTVYTATPRYIHYNWLADKDTSYYYDTKNRNLVVVWRDGEDVKQRVLKEDVICHYLYVTPDWYFCALEEDGVCTLYRAENYPEKFEIGELEIIDTGIAAKENKIVIRNGYAYYWKGYEGLYSVRMDGGYPRLRYSIGSVSNCFGWKTFHVDDELLYFVSPVGGIYTISISDGKLTHVFDNRDNAGRMELAVFGCEKIFYVLKYAEDGVRTAPDQIWSMNPDGSDAKIVYALGSFDQEILFINSNDDALYLRMSGSEESNIYKIMHTGGEINLIYSPS